MLLKRASAFMSGTSKTSGWSGASVKAHTPMPHGSSAPTALQEGVLKEVVATTVFLCLNIARTA